MFRKIVFLLSLPFLLSCSSEGNRKTAENEAAFERYKTFVTDYERDSLTETKRRAMQQEPIDSAEWAVMKAERQQQFDERRQGIAQHMEQYNPAQREEIEGLEERYNTAAEAREKRYQDVSRRYRLRQQLLGIEVSEDDLSNIAPENLASTYQRFVDRVAENAEEYENRDWNLIEGWWSALNSRYNDLQKDLQPQSRNNIEKAQTRYKELRQQVNS